MGQTHLGQNEPTIADFSPWFHLPGFNLGHYPILTHSQMSVGFWALPTWVYIWFHEMDDTDMTVVSTGGRPVRGVAPFLRQTHDMMMSFLCPMNFPSIAERWGHPCLLRKLTGNR